MIGTRSSLTIQTGWQPCARFRAHDVQEFMSAALDLFDRDFRRGAGMALF